MASDEFRDGYVKACDDMILWLKEKGIEKSSDGGSIIVYTKLGLHDIPVKILSLKKEIVEG
jgi:hypothetical protein